MKRYLPLFFISCLLIFTACKKDDFITGVNQRQLKINLNTHFLPAEKIDSAFLFTEFLGPQNKIKLQVKDNTLETNISSFSQSTGKMMIQLYSSTKYLGKSVQFEKELSLDLIGGQTITVNAPTAVMDLSWKPRVILDFHGINMRYTAIVGLRTSDPYFEIQNLPSWWNKRITVERSFYKGNYQTKVIEKIWDCNNNCLGNQVNRDFFINLANQVNHLNWDKYAIEVGFNTSPNTVDMLHFEYNK